MTEVAVGTDTKLKSAEQQPKASSHHSFPDNNFHIDVYQYGESVDLLADFVAENMWLAELLPDFGSFSGLVLSGAASSLQTNARMAANMPVMAFRSYVGGMANAAISFLPIDAVTKLFTPKPLGKIVGDAIAGKVDWQAKRAESYAKDPNQFRIANYEWGKKLEDILSKVNSTFVKLLGRQDEIKEISELAKSGDKEKAKEAALKLFGAVLKDESTNSKSESDIKITPVLESKVTANHLKLENGAHGKTRAVGLELA